MELERLEITMGENITDEGYMWMAINHINKEIDALRSENDTLRNQLSELKNLGVGTYFKNENDILQRKLNITIEALNRIGLSTNEFIISGIVHGTLSVIRQIGEEKK